MCIRDSHNPTASGWSGTYNLSDEESDDGSASIIGNYTLKKSGKYNNSASCKAVSYTHLIPSQRNHDR